MKNFLIGLVPNKVFVIITHCDLVNPEDNEISEMIEEYKILSGLKIPPENVIKFGNVEEHLKPLFDLNSQCFNYAPMTLTNDLKVAVAKIKLELLSFFTNMS